MSTATPEPEVPPETPPQTETPEAPEVAGEAVEGLSDQVEPLAEVVHIQSRTGKGVLSIDPNQEKWTPVQVTALRSIGVETEGANAVPFPYVWQFLHTCQKADLDPFLREAYLITHGKKWTKDSGEVVDNRKFTLVTGIDGFRKKAEDTGEYVGQVGPEWLTKDGQWVDFWLPKWGKPEAARVGIMRKGFDAPVYGVAIYSEFEAVMDEYEEVTKTGRNGGTYKAREKTGRKVPTGMWEKMPANQIAKCAEAQGFRKAFPRTMTGMYEAAEMSRAQAEYQSQQEGEQARQQAQRRLDAMRAAGAAPQAPQDAATAPESAAKDVVDAEVVDGPDDATKAAWLLVELAYQADVLGTDVETLTARPVKALGKPLDEFTADELLRGVSGMRPTVLARLVENEDPDAEPYGTLTPDAVVDFAAFMPGPDDAADESEDDDPATREHPFADDGEGICQDCGLREDLGPHPE